jgi:hypothetical protein
MDITTALTVAVSFWGAHGVTPCAPIHANPVPQSVLDAVHPGIMAVADADINTCTIRLGSEFRFMVKLYGPKWGCAVVAHEVGHLGGVDHVAGYGRLMSATYGVRAPRDTPPACSVLDSRHERTR